MNQTELTALIRQTAYSLGFCKIGIIAADPIQADSGRRLKEWIDSGYHAEMAWMVNHLEKRLEPACLMENTRSIVCLAMNYYTPDEYDREKPDSLKIAKYARGTDYHYVIKDRLKILLAQLQERFPEITGRAFTDSAPIMEKPLAVQSGVGWMGKNGNVIIPGQGSWVFLGELFLNVTLDYDSEKVADHCGNCSRCIDACPTEAIVGDGIIDANRCLSYWTIEYKGDSFPKSIQEKQSGWIFGCDICQDVCPWNIKFATVTTEAAFQPRPLNRQPEATTLLALDDTSFRANFQKSPVKRTKLSGFRRNILSAIHNPPLESPTED